MAGAATGGIRIARGCSSVVEHFLAKEDVASSSLVTRSPFSKEAYRSVRGGTAYYSRCSGLQQKLDGLFKLLVLSLGNRFVVVGDLDIRLDVSVFHERASLVAEADFRDAEEE